MRLWDKDALTTAVGLTKKKKKTTTVVGLHHSTKVEEKESLLHVGFLFNLLFSHKHN